MSYYPPPDGYQGGPPQNQGFNNSGAGFPQQSYGGSDLNQGPSGYHSQQNYGGGTGYGQPGGDYGQHSGGFPTQQAYPGGGSGTYPQDGGYNQGAPGGYPQGGSLPGGFQDASQVPVEHLPPGINPATRRPYEAHELPRGASPAPEGYEGYVPEGMSHQEAQERGFLGATGGGLLGAWLGHKFGKTHGNHGFLGTIGGAGLGGWLGNKIF